MAFMEVSADQPCPVCEKTDWCRIDLETNRAECHRPYGEPLKYTASGYGIYRIAAGEVYEKPPENISSAQPEVRNKADIVTLNKVYSALLDMLTLSSGHRDNLRKRGLEDTDIDKLRYKSMPSSDREPIIERLRTMFGDKLLSGVPGFAMRDRRVVKLLGHSGILLPCISQDGLIQGFQIRSDEQRGYRWLSSSECSIKSPIHFVGDKGSDTLYITEGIIKSDIASIKLSVPFIGFAGVNAWMNQRSALTDIISRTRARKLIIAFDADADEKLGVRKALSALVKFLDGSDYQVQSAQWDLSDGKGIDDLLVSGHSPTIYDADDAPDYVERLIERAIDLSPRAQLRIVREILDEIRSADPIEQDVYLQLMKQSGLGALGTLRKQLDQSSEPVTASTSSDRPPQSAPSTDATEAEPPQKISVCLSLTSGIGRHDPVDLINNSLLPSIADILKGDPDLFLRNGKLVRVSTDENRRATIEEHSVDTLQVWLGEHFHFYTLKGKGEELIPITVPAPTYVAKSLLAYNNYPSTIPVLEMVTEFPVITSSGVHINYGYNPASRAFLIRSASIDYDAIEVTDASIAWSKAQIFDNLIVDFKFDSPASRSNFVGYLLSFPIRPIIPDAVPMYTVTAPVQGSGKTKLVDLAHVIWTGRKAEAKAGGSGSGERGNEEWRKRILTYLLSGKSSLFFDNIRGIVNSEALASALTANWYSDRVLSLSEERTLKVRCLWAMSGNNIEFEEDMPRRVYRSHIDTGMESPETRSDFKHEDIVGWAETHRLDLMKACFTLIKAWDLSGRPLCTDINWGSYENFTQVIGGVLQSAGISDFLANRERFIPPDMDAWREFFNTWAERHGVVHGTNIGRFVNGKWTNDDVEEPMDAVTIKELMPIGSRRDGEEGADDLDILGQWVRGNNEHSRKIRLGQLINQYLGRIYNQYKLEKLDKKKGGSNQFRLVYSSDDNGNTPPVSDDAHDDAVPFEMDDLVTDDNASNESSIEDRIESSKIGMPSKISLRTALARRCSRVAIERALDAYEQGDADKAREIIANAEDNS